MTDQSKSMTLTDTIEKVIEAHYRVMNVVGDFSSYRCACGAVPWLDSHLASELSKAVEGHMKELGYVLRIARSASHSSHEPAAPASGALTSDKDGNFVSQSRELATQICDKLEPGFKWPDSKFRYIADVIQGALLDLRRRLRSEAK